MKSVNSNIDEDNVSEEYKEEQNDGLSQTSDYEF